MSKNIGELAGEIYGLLSSLEPEESSKVLTSVATLLGVVTPQAYNDNHNDEVSNLGGYDSDISDAKTFFEEKKPNNKGEQFAVAAFYRCEKGLGDVHTKEDLKRIIKTEAKITFDDKHFNRDIENAKRQAGFFFAGDSQGEYVLSADGENYVKALPDRKEAKKFRKSKKSPAKKKK